MKILVIETSQWRSYYADRYRQMVALGGDVHLLCGESEPGAWPSQRIVGSLDIDGLLRMAEEWHAEEQFDGVLTFAEMSVIATAAVAERLGLPGIGVDAARTSRNKFLMRQTHALHDVPRPAFAPVATVAEALSVAADIGYPVILKPTLGASSAFVFRVDSAEELTERFPYANAGIGSMMAFALEASGIDLGPNTLLVEEFLDGSEHLIEGTVWDGEFSTGVMVDRITVEGSTFDDDVHHAPSGLAPEQLTKIHEVVAAAVRAQGLTHCAVHAEVRFHRGVPHILEVAARLGGGSMDGMARLSGGHSPIAAAMDIAVGRRPVLRPYQPTDVHTVGICLLTPPGVINEVLVAEEVTTSEQVFHLHIPSQPGDVVRRPPEGNDMLGYLYVSGASFDEAMSTANRFADSIKVAFAE
ncbi:ATP-grasp domain-containing protein [Micromonospora sp. DT231]|uniref:ATP-grasp domain-containing protein n=1 Tax=Micromonospora sp. DT231 TaxID=3416526 RepID=UPI003CF8E79F